MEQPTHSMSNLFAQLGQPCDEPGIETFIAAKRPLAGHIRLDEAAFWSASQALFLREAIGDDADWAEVAEALNSELRAPVVVMPYA
ncbi:MAG: DUF2789 family protein [Azonexus sp.]